MDLRSESPKHVTALELRSLPDKVDMSIRNTLLKELLRQRHWQTYSSFCRRYDDVARGVDPSMIGHWPSRGQFARWLAGDIKGLPHSDHCRVLEGMFPGRSVSELLQLVPPLLHDAQDDLHTSSDLDPHMDGLGGMRHPGTASTVHAVRSDLRSRAEVSQPSTERPIHDEIALATQESAQFTRRTRGSVDRETLDQLEADVGQLAAEYLTSPPIMIFAPVARLRRDVFELLDQRQRPSLLPDLYGIAGKLCALLAHVGADLGHGYAAGTHTRTAWLCADLADDNPLRAYVRWVQSNIAFWAGDYHRAAEIARSGRLHATSGSSLLRLASQEARAWAACNDRPLVEEALAIAAQARQRNVPDNQPGVFRFDRGKAAYYASEVRLALGGKRNAELAALEAEQALKLFKLEPADRQCPEYVAAANLDLANAQLQLGELDEAADQLLTVLQLPTEKRTKPIISRMNLTAITLSHSRFSQKSLATDLSQEIVIFQSHSATRGLPKVLT